LHAEDNTKTGNWVECDDGVSLALDRDDSKPSYILLPELLKHMRIMLFSGDKDLICNHLGTEMMIDALTWSGVKGWETQHTKTSWIVDDYIAGINQTERNLTYLLFHNASHMVAVDNPKATLDMMNRFMGITTNVRVFAKMLIVAKTTGDATVPVGPPAPVKKPVQHYYVIGTLMLLFVIGFAAVAGYLFIKGRENGGDLEAIRDGSWHELEEEENPGFLEEDSDNERV